MDIRQDPLTSPEIAALLQEHIDEMYLHSPPESVHALDLQKLRAPEITFWSAWEGEALVGCVAIKELDLTHGEIKSMRTAKAHQRKGIGALLMRHVLEEAKRRRYLRLSLETGSMDAFIPARTLYGRFGFEYCGPFAQYVDDPYSSFMTRTL